MVSRGGCSATNGLVAETSKKAAPVRRTVLSTSESTSTGMATSRRALLAESGRAIKRCGRPVIRLRGARVYGKDVSAAIGPGDAAARTRRKGSMNIQTTVPAAIDFAAIKTRQRTVWSAGDYARIGATLQIVGETLC